MDQLPDIELPVIPPDKKRAYTLFLALLQAAVIHIAFALTALASFAFGHMASVVMGFSTLAIGTLVVSSISPGVQASPFPSSSWR